ncbi:class III extradiol ring-cleavage dioxygenase [Hydrogenophaga sp.]|uniref:dioxygenase family protein n=1 Tax=Hydrogenophaga sp. TaxID=1904254 RepID=UPI00260CEA65|nr:class III extradiol ring-cleavage dioxygenase [Hydrogenophaga sp.]MCW5652939.1 dioxygenase [Hydrogenophaga sp.]
MNTLPSLFVSHGAPSYALEPGLAGAQLGALGRALPRPRAVLVVSPHWMTHQAAVATSPRPATIHDFGGFAPALYDLAYPAPGEPALAGRALALLQAEGWNARADAQRGLDHGAWVPLMHLFPQADVPAFQVSLPARLQAQAAFDFGRALAPLAAEGVLIVGSGSLTHNLYEFREHHAGEAGYAVAFTEWVREAVQTGDVARLVHTLERAPHAQRAHPTAEHFLPLLVALGAAPAALPATVLPGGVVHGVLSMESYVFGEAIALEPVAALETA